jgi:hypothetical protein
MAWNYDPPRQIYPDAQSALSTGEGLGVTRSTSGRTPYERALRNLYMRANRNRAKDPQALVDAAALAEKKGVDVSGSLTAASQENTRNQRLAETRQAEELIALPGRYKKAQQDRIRSMMRKAASEGKDVTSFREQAIAAGAEPGQFNRAAAWMTKNLKPKDVTAGGPITTGTPGVDDVPTKVTPGQYVMKSDAVDNLPQKDWTKINNGEATVAVPEIKPPLKPPFDVPSNPPVPPAPVPAEKNKIPSKLPERALGFQPGGRADPYGVYGRKFKNGGKVDALMMKGEYVMKKSAVDKYGDGFMDQLNAGNVRKDAKGRFVLKSKK